MKRIILEVIEKEQRKASSLNAKHTIRPQTDGEILQIKEESQQKLIQTMQSRLEMSQSET